jgi:hypothetical protein
MPFEAIRFSQNVKFLTYIGADIIAASHDNRGKFVLTIDKIQGLRPVLCETGQDIKQCHALTETRTRCPTVEHVATAATRHTGDDVSTVTNGENVGDKSGKNLTDARLIPRAKNNGLIWLNLRCRCKVPQTKLAGTQTVTGIRCHIERAPEHRVRLCDEILCVNEYFILAQIHCQ